MLQSRSLPAASLALSIVLLAAPATAQAIEDAGPLAVGWRDVVVTAGDQARLYYPAQAAGQGAAPDPGAGPYPLVAFQHGWLGSPSDYDQLCTHIASWGFFVGSTAEQGGFFGAMQPEAQASKRLLEWMDSESSTLGSTWAGMAADGDWSAVGHSMGGGALFYLIGIEPRVLMLVALQPYNGSSLGGSAGGIANLASFTGRVLFLAGEVDSTVPPASQVQPYFVAAANTERNLYAEVLGMGHLGPTDLPSTGDPLPAVEQKRLHRRYTTGFLRAEVEPAENLYIDLLGQGTAAEPVELDSRCAVPPLWGILDESASLATLRYGLAGEPLDFAFVYAALGTASIPSIYGTIGLDPNPSWVLLQSLLGATGIASPDLAVPPAASGLTVYLQGVAISNSDGQVTGVVEVSLP